MVFGLGGPKGVKPAPQPPAGRPVRARLPRRLARWRRAARAVLIFEAIWPILWPPAAILAVYLCAALLGWPQSLGRPLNTLLMVGDAALAALWLGLAVWRIRWPTDAAARRRLQTASGLAHDPVAALEDMPAQTDPVSFAVWQEHRRRSIAAASRLRLRLPWPWLTRRDRMLFRGGVVAALLLCLWVAGPAARGRLGAAFTFDFALFAGGTATPPAVTAWITPPAYTGRAPLLLPGHDAALSIPAGSRLTVTVSGVHQAPTLLGDPDHFQALDSDSFQLDTTLNRSGLLTLRGGGERLARWTLTALRDQPPTIAFAKPPGPDQDGAGQNSASLRLAWHATDDYGVVSAQMTAHLATRPGSDPLTLPLSLPGGPAPSIDQVQVADLTANPWAGLPVTMRLTDRDAVGQLGASPDVTAILPERRFADRQARAVIAIRKGLVLMPNASDPNARAAAAQALFQTGAAAIAAGKSAQAVLPLMATAWQLIDDRDPAAVPAAIDQLWQVALHLEQGDAADTAEALQKANEALKDALQSRSPAPGDLARLMQAVQAAVLEHLSTLMQMAQRQGGSIGTPPSPNAGARSLDLAGLARQLRAMQAAAQAGDVQAMRQDLAALEQSLQALEQARVVKPDPAQAAARAQAMKDLAGLQSMMRQQARLMDNSARRAGAEAPDPAGDARDAQAQAALRQALSAMSPRLGPTIAGAGQAMGQAVQQLQAQQDQQATNAQQKAVLALQQAANALGKRLAQQGGQGGPMEIGGTQPGGQPGGQDGFSQGNGDTDPLGRPLSEGQGTSLGADVAIPSGTGQARLRAILHELRDKAGDRSLTPGELDYIERLLQPF